MSESSQPPKDEPSGENYRRDRFIALLNRTSDLSADDRRKAYAVVLAISLANGDTPLAIEALLRNELRDAEVTGFANALDSRDFIEDSGWFEEYVARVDPGDSTTGAPAISDLKKELERVRSGEARGQRLLPFPLLDQLSHAQLTQTLPHLELVDVPAANQLSSGTEDAYEWYLRGLVTSPDGVVSSLVPGSLLVATKAGRFRAGAGGAVILRLPFSSAVGEGGIENFGLLSATVEWSKMIWASLIAITPGGSSATATAARLFDAAELVTEPDALKAFSDAWVLSIKRSQPVRQDIAQVDLDANDVLPALVWGKDDWSAVLRRA